MLANIGKSMAEIRHLISIEAPPQRVYSALATQAGLASWWTADTRADDKAEFGFDKRGMTFRMTIATLDPGREVVWKCHGDNPEWDGTTLTWTITPEDDGSLLRFTQSGWKDMTDMVATIGNLCPKLSRPIAVSDQAARADDLDGAVTEHLDGVAPLPRFVGEYRDHGSLDVVAVGLLDPVADLEA
jgi:uncharacterized protein YndB with AHSA1/START domain